MVDVSAATQGKGVSRGRHSHAMRADTLIDVRPADEAALADYESFCGRGIHAPAQSPLWIRSWIKAADADAIIVTIRRDGRQAFALALEIVREGPFRIARFMGGGHANGNFIATATGESEPLAASDRVIVAKALREARPDIDLIFLQRQNPRHDGLQNPLSALPHIQSPNISLAVNLDGGFDTMLSRSSGKRKRKKYRLQIRKFEEAGGYRLIEAQTPEEIDRLLTEYFAMKAVRFRKKGITNVFGSKEVQDFFHALFQDALKHQPQPFVLHGVEVAGEIRAVNGISVTPHSVICEFGGIRDDDGSNASPGYFLDYTNIEQACREGKEIYDFSVGEEDYKRSWCDIETWQFDTLIPTSPKGRLLWVHKVVRSEVIRFVKSNRLIWSFVKRMRTNVAATKSNDD